MIYVIIILSVVSIVLAAMMAASIHKNTNLTKALKAEAEKVDRLEANKTDLEKTIASQATELEGYRPIGRSIEEAAKRAKELEELVNSTSEKLQGLKDDISTAEVTLRQKKVESEKLDAEITQRKTETEKAKADCQAVIDRLRELQGLEKSSEVLDSADAVMEKLSQIDEVLKAIKVDRGTTEQLAYSFRIKHDYAYVIGLDINGLIAVAYGFGYDHWSHVNADHLGGPYVNTSNFEAGWKTLVSNPDVVTWVVIGMKKNGESFVFMNKTFTFPEEAKVISAELTERIKETYGGRNNSDREGRFAMLADKQAALETKRAELVKQLDALNVQAAATVGIDAILAS